MKENIFAQRLEAFVKVLKKKKIDLALVRNQANVRSLTGVDCDNVCLTVTPKGEVVFFTDFRYVPMCHRVAPWMKVGEIKKLKDAKGYPVKKPAKIGYEGTISAAKYLEWTKLFRKAKFVDIDGEVKALRAVKTADELEKLRAAEKLNDEIWSEAQKSFRPGMTEREMARVIQHLMIERGEGEAFETIVCVGANAAECHHVPDDTKWNGEEPILVDMGVKLNGYCSDMTRNYVPRAAGADYRRIYSTVLEANELGIRSVKPGITSGELDRIVRSFLAKKGFKKEFGHSLGHGVGIEIHESPWAAKKQKTVLKPGMSVTIEPGLYVEGKYGVRIEDLVLVTEDGCEVISHSAK